MRAVLDTNVLVSAFIVKKGVPAQILHAISAWPNPNDDVFELRLAV
jgi:predicted nucleic acid-binding protein